MHYLHGMHDAGGEHLFGDRPGWVVVTEAIGANPNDRSGRDYAHLAPHGVIVRLNHGYGREGTIPSPSLYASFAQRAANFVAASRGCTRWIIGNEPGHRQEWPNGVMIRALDYVTCYRLCAAAIRAVKGERHLVMPAAIAPWNIEAGDWLGYFRDVLAGAGGLIDGIALHTYTHGADPALITSEAVMDAPFGDRRFHFRAYRDFLAAVPSALRSLPVWITETNQDGPWLDADNGWMQAALREVNAWNRAGQGQRVHGVCWYRWLNHDHWNIATKPQVQNMVRAAAGLGVPAPGGATAVQASHTVHLPMLGNGPALPTPPAPQPDREWDPRLTARGVTIETPATGGDYWRVVRGQWFDPKEGGGKHHILVDVLDAGGGRLAGVALRVEWPGGSARVVSQAKPGEAWAADFPLSPSRNEFSIRVEGAQPSETVRGIGMGADLGGGFNAGEHTSTGLVFRLTSKSATPPEPAPPVAPPEPAPPVAPPATPGVGPGLLDPRVMQAVMAVEAAGKTHGADGKALVRFEAHVFRTRLNNDGLWARHFRVGSPPWTNQEWRPAENAAWRAIHTGRQADEYAALEFAAGLRQEAAYESISMGVGQTMGFHFARLGYPSAFAMWQAMTESGPAQVLAMCNFVLGDPILHRAVNARDWAEIGRRYNGSAAAGDLYRAAYVRLWGQP